VACVRIVCDGGGSLGFGNLRRSATLASAFKSHGFKVRVDVLSDEGRRLLPPSPQDVQAADVWLLDIPYDADSLVIAARREKCPVAALDFQGGIPPDLVISIFRRGSAPVTGRQLFGLEYAIIRPEIARLAPAPAGGGVIVVIGGGDQEGVGERVALALDLQGSSVTLVDGPLAAIGPNPLPPQIQRVSSPPDLAARMASCLWGVTGGGGTMLEMMCLGKPVHVMPRTTHERALAQSIFDRGGVLGMGFETLAPPTSSQLARVSVAARKLVDGRGAQRIIEAVDTLL
jgi:spore coat polysaccharide biosynthesis predicted glycosyltransferase SpsG